MNLEFQILDVDYVLIDEKPIVRLFGKTEKGETVCGFVENYLPYFYTKGDPSEFLKGNAQVLSIEKSKMRKIDGSEGLYKITLKNPSKTPEIREGLKAKKLEVFEADILFKNRFLADHNIGGMGWVKAEGQEINTNTVNVGKRMKIAKIERIKKDLDADLKCLALDIECCSLEGARMPEAGKDPIIMVSVVFSHDYKGKKDLVLSTRGGKGVTASPEEKKMLEELITIINEYDPDILTGYNCCAFDFPYILERMKQTGVKPMFARCKQKSVYSTQVGTETRVNVTGRIVADPLLIIRQDFSLLRYGLDFVAPTLLGKRKEDVKKSEILKYWRGTQGNFEKLVSYCRTDSILALELLLKLNLLNKYKALSKVSGIVLQDTLDAGEATRIENYLLREFNAAGYVSPCKPDSQEIKERMKKSKIELKGGFVLEPKRGLHSYVAVLDFKSMYPSIIRTYNICPTTIVKAAGEGVQETPTGTFFYKPEIKQGVIPTIVENLMEGRDRVKKQMKEERDPLKKSILDAEQWALKILANAFYGYFGYVRARIYNLDVANTITSCGRSIINDTIKKLEAKGYEIVYGDTDSVFVKMGIEDFDKIKEEAIKITKEISEGLPGIMELQFEKIFKRFLPLSKKRYVAWRFDFGKDGWTDKMEMKGVETVRRDWCPLVTKSMKEVLNIVLKESDVKKAIAYFKEIVIKLNKNEIGLEDLSITKTLTKKPESYAGVQPHVEVVKKMVSRGEEAGLGDRIGYVIIKGIDLLSRRAEDPNYVKEKGLEIDSKYYIENQLFPPLERIFNALGIEKTEILGGGKQMGLFDAIRNGNGHVKEEVKLEEVTGFICKNCNKFYQSLGLSSLCECGGEFLFNSKKGQAVEVLVS